MSWALKTGDRIRVYVNGVQDGPTTAQGPPGSTAGMNLQIGRGGSSLQRWFNGIIDEVRISDRALTPEEIAANYSLGRRKVLLEGGREPRQLQHDLRDESVHRRRTARSSADQPGGSGGDRRQHACLHVERHGGSGRDLHASVRAGCRVYERGADDQRSRCGYLHRPCPDALADNTYYWHVQAIDQWSNPSGYQAVPFSFSVDAAAPRRRPASPSDQGTRSAR